MTQIVDLSHSFGQGHGSYPGLPQPVVRDQLSFDDSSSRYETGTEFNIKIFEMVANPNLTQNEIDAMNTVRLDYWNPQEQRKFVWPPSFAMARAFVDQLERSKGLSAARITAVRAQLLTAERAAAGTARRTALTALATELGNDAAGSSDRAKLQMLIGTVNDLGK